jgi:hypothetical protein
MSTSTTREARYQRSIEETVAEIARRLDVDTAMAERLWEAMSEAYDVLGETGRCDGARGMESMRVIPDALDFIRHEANATPRTPDPFEVLGWSR